MQQNDNNEVYSEYFTTPEFEFEEWKNLYANDHVAFEEKRQHLLNDLVSSAPKEYQNRLAGIVEQIDNSRNSSNTPLQSCIDAIQMMQNSVLDLRYFLNDLNYEISQKMTRIVDNHGH